MGNSTFAENVKHLRELEALKQSEMLDTLGFKQTTWNGYERGGSTPNIDDLIKISDFFGILESDLLRTEISLSDIHTLYNSYIARHAEPENIGNTPHAKTFLNYYNTHQWATALNKSTNTTGKSGRKKNTRYLIGDDHIAPSILNEPGAIYHNTAMPANLEARLARLEAIYDALKEILNLGSL